MGVSVDGGFSPQIIHGLIGVFHVKKHPFWGTTIFGNTQMEGHGGHLLKTWPEIIQWATGEKLN